MPTIIEPLSEQVVAVYQQDEGEVSCVILEDKDVAAMYKAFESRHRASRGLPERRSYRSHLSPRPENDSSGLKGELA